jgi:hypothetical protein
MTLALATTLAVVAAPAPAATEVPMPGLVATGAVTTSQQVLPQAGTPLSTIGRDCGFTISLSNGTALWVFCDSTDADVSGAGLTYFVNNTAAIGPAHDPLNLREPWDPNGDPYQFIVPSDAPYSPCGPGQRHVVWPISGTRAGGGPGNDRVIVFYENICQTIATLANTPVSTGVAEWWFDTSKPLDHYLSGPIRATIVQPNLFPRPVGGTPWGVGAVDGRDGYVYVHRCDGGNCSAARAPISGFGSPGAYSYWTGSGWSPSAPSGTGQVAFLAGGPYSATQIQFVSPLNTFIMTAWDPATGRHAIVFAGPSPVGPWTKPISVLMPGCDPAPLPPHGRACYHATVHDHLSTPSSLAVGIHDALADRNGRLTTNHRVAQVPVSTIGLNGALEQLQTPKGQLSVSGWAFERNTTAAVQVELWSGVSKLDVLPASTYRADIKAAFPDTTGNVGFSGVVAAPLGPQRVCVKAVRTVGPGGPATLGCQDVFVPDPASPFLDVLSASPFFADIVWMIDQDITTGYPGELFKPAAPVSRQVMAAFLYRMAGSPAFSPPEVSPFSDVATSSTFYLPITWLASTGVTTGYDDNTFRPSATVSRQAMAGFLYRLAGSPPYSPPEVSPFSDVALSNPFYGSISWLNDSTITTGYSDGTFQPSGGVARQAMSAFLHRYVTTGTPILPG